MVVEKGNKTSMRVCYLTETVGNERDKGKKIGMKRNHVQSHPIRQTPKDSNS